MQENSGRAWNDNKGNARKLASLPARTEKVVSLYCVTLQVKVFVDINEATLVPDTKPGFQGDTPEVAVNRALWSLMRHDLATHAAFGIKSQNYCKDNAQVEIVDGRTDELAE